MVTPAKAQWRPLQSGDLAALCRIAAVCHPAFPEKAAVLAEKQRLAPDCCFALAAGDGEDGLYGYLLAHPWRLFDIPAFDRCLTAIPQAADFIYLHDLALLPPARGGGYAQGVIALLEARALAAGCWALALVAVNNSAGFWRHQGFAAVTPTAAMDKKLKTYSGDALYMVKKSLSGGGDTVTGAAPGSGHTA